MHTQQVEINDSLGHIYVPVMDSDGRHYQVVYYLALQDKEARAAMTRARIRSLPIYIGRGPNETKTTLVLTLC